MKTPYAMARMAAAIMAHAAAQAGAPWQRNIRMRRPMPRLTPAYRGKLGTREVGRYRHDDRGICHRIPRGERS